MCINIRSTKISKLNWWGGPYTNSMNPSYGFAGPFGIAFDGCNLWTTNFNSGSGSSLTEIKASSGAFVQNISNSTNPSYGFNGPFNVIFDGTHLWVTNFQGNSVTGFNASDGSWFMTLSGAPYNFTNPANLVFDGTNIWVTNYTNSTITVFVATTGAFVQIIANSVNGFPATAFNNPYGITFDGTNIWIVNYTGNSATQMTNANPSVWLQTISGGSFGFVEPYLIIYNGSNLWVSNSAEHGGTPSMTELDTSGNFIQNLVGGTGGFPASVFSYPFGMAFDGSQLYVTNHNNNTVVTFTTTNPATYVATYSSPSYGFNLPFSIAYDGQYMWIANSGNSSVSNIYVK